MRAEFATAMLQLSKLRPEIIFLSGDLGYMALEELQSQMKERFINAGVAEQNMISVAAGLAFKNFMPWVYSIAPFATLRPYEQLRNDVCFHKLPVKIVGNGGGYGYGIMGPTHHTLQDIGLMRMLPDMKIYLPVFPSDVAEAVAAIAAQPGPAYLRLNQGVPDEHRPSAFADWRKLGRGRSAVVISAGPVVGNMLDVARNHFPEVFEIWSVGIFPLTHIPEALIEALTRTGRLITLEEHGAAGGIGEAMSSQLIGKLSVPLRYKALFAQGYLSQRFGSQKWHQEENGLAGEPLRKELKDFLDD